jgi:hypothetical protein
MRNLGETLSGRVEKIKGLLGIKAKKIVEEKSDDLFSALTTVPEQQIQEQPYMEVVRDEGPSTPNEQTPEPTAMAA